MPRSTHATVTRWTAKDTATAVRLYRDGHTFTDIAQTLKRTRGEVAGKLFRLRREGAVVGRVVKEQPPPRETKKPKLPPPPKPRRPQPIRMPKMSQEPRPPRPIPPAPLPPTPTPIPPWPPTCWELKHQQCRFPI